MTHRTIEARGEKLLTPLTVEQAAYACEGLAKSTYERMFQWLVQRLNSSLENKVNAMIKSSSHHFTFQSKVRKNVMGLLDIYGFEIFVVNRYACIC